MILTPKNCINYMPHVINNRKTFYVMTAQKVPGIKMVTDDGIFEVMLESGTSEARVGQQISIFAMEPDTHIESQNLKYPLNGLAPERWWQATLNESLATTFTLTFPEKHPLLIYKAF